MRTLTKTKEQVKKMTQKEFQDLLVANTDKNYHTENVVYIAYRYADAYYITYAEMILMAHIKLGEMTPELNDHRNHVLECLKSRITPTHQATVWSCL